MNFLETPMRNVQGIPNSQRYSTFPTLTRSRKLSTHIVDKSVRKSPFNPQNEASKKHFDLIAQNLDTALTQLHHNGKITLHAINPELNVKRYYILRLNTNLFGETTLSTSYGRISSKGQLKHYYFESQDDANKFTQSTLRKRLNSKNRIGVDYMIVI